MAMMMTGRVLLVCALCVLWCGAGGGDALFLDDPKLHEYYYGAYGVYCNRSSLGAKFCEEKRKSSKPEADASREVNAAHSSDGSELLSGGGSSGGGQAQSLPESGTSRPGGPTDTQELSPTGEGETVTIPSPQQAPPVPPSPATPSLPAVSTSALTENLPKTVNLPKPVVQDDSENSNTTTEPQAANNSQPQSGTLAGATEAPTLTTAPPAEVPDNSTEETDSDRPEGEDDGTQESQPLKGNETETPTTATVTAAQTN
ncbi:mucin-associated surface protein (MASP), putative, partial [Trypanosoma cruzi marinkellei]